MKLTRLPGIISYATIALWFLLTVMTPLSTRAETTPSTIRVSDLLPTIEAALFENGISPDAVVTLEAPETTIIVESATSVRFDSISVNPVSGRFLIRAKGASDAPSVSIGGRAATMRSFPVLARPVERGHLISESDIIFTDRNDLQASLYVLDVQDLIGKQTRRPLRANSPIRPNDTVAPVLVKKGAIVTMTYSNDGLRLSYQGLATQAGALGDVINVENIKSERTVKAVITGNNRARVIGARQTIASNSEI